VSGKQGDSGRSSGFLSRIFVVTAIISLAVLSAVYFVSIQKKQEIEKQAISEQVMSDSVVADKAESGKKSGSPTGGRRIRQTDTQRRRQTYGAVLSENPVSRI